MTADDKTLCVDAVQRLYEAANLPPPRVVFVPSPFVLRFAGGFASEYFRNTRAATSAATSAATRDATHAATSAAIHAATYAATRDATHAATSAAIHAATYDATRDATHAATYDATHAAIHAATRDATHAATYDATSAATHAATRDATRAATSAATSAATRDATHAATSAAIHAATYDATRDATHAATYDATHAAIHAATYDATHAAIHAATYDATRDATYDATRDATSAATHAATHAATWYIVSGNPGKHRTIMELQAAKQIYDTSWQGANQWSAWDAFLSFFRHVVKLDLPQYAQWEAWETLSLLSGPRIVRKEFCMISDRPCILKIDAQNRPHCEDGPFCAWRDGSMLFAVHGVRVPAWIILYPERLTVEKIQKENNAEIRRIMVNKFGPSRYIRESGAKELQKDDFGTLWQAPLKKDEPLTLVEVFNSTPEPDGSFRNYWLRVAPDLKPMRWNAKENKYETFGNPQVLTARNAVASTFGLRGEEYDPVIET